MFSIGTNLNFIERLVGLPTSDISNFKPIADWTDFPDQLEKKLFDYTPLHSDVVKIISGYLFKQITYKLQSRDRTLFGRIDRMIQGDTFENLKTRVSKFFYVTHNDWFSPQYRSPNLRLNFEPNDKIKPPIEMEGICQSPCPFIKGKKIRDTHILICLPKDLNVLLTPNVWWDRDSRKYKIFSNELTKQIHNTKSCWSLILIAPFWESRDKNYIQQKELLKQRAREWEFPSLREMILTRITSGIFNALGTRCCEFEGNKHLVSGLIGPYGIYRSETLVEDALQDNQLGLVPVRRFYTE